MAKKADKETRRKEFLEYRRVKQAEICADRARRGVCRICEKPCETSSLTGKKAKLCPVHLKMDVDRRRHHILPLEEELEVVDSGSYLLRWHDEIGRR